MQQHLPEDVYIVTAFFVRNAKAVSLSNGKDVLFLSTASASLSGNLALLGPLNPFLSVREARFSESSEAEQDGKRSEDRRSPHSIPCRTLGKQSWKAEEHFKGC